MQDFLDYAQIKSGKFRINIKPFNIHQTLEKVMCIQREKAVEGGLEFVAHTPSIRLEEEVASPSCRKSPLVYTDEQRVMQVLLNL